MASGERARGTYTKTPGRRREIVVAALAVFAERGYDRGSLRAVAERAGISEAGILFHFGSKAALLSAVLELRDERSRSRAAHGAAPGLDQVRAFLEIVRSSAAEPGLVELYTTLAAEAVRSDHPAHEYFREHYASVTEMARASFVALRDAGQLRAGVEPGHAARSMVALVDGLQTQWLYDPAGVDLVAETRAHLQSLLAVPL